ncbi:MAG: HAD-IIB family hydrolase [Dehalococcoidia bacterium]|nr:HAD-IIB family hydrolase [Dehalococcoidia bacterium]
MRYFALACDYDGTIATDGRVDPATLAALQEIKATGRRLLLVTGRELDDLQEVFPELEIFDWVVAENGALLYQPSTREETALAAAITTDFAEALTKRGVEPVRRGRVIVATWEPHETTVLETIRDLGLELQVIFNKGAVMVLPSGVNKASGLTEALHRLELSPHNVVGVGDAENDHAFLSACEFGAAVENALPMLKERADLVLKRDHGAGVIELVKKMVDDDLRRLDRKVRRHAISVGADKRGRPMEIEPYGLNLLFAGPSGGGKSTLAKGFLEGLVDQDYQFCVIDPEGDYEDFEAAVVLGDRTRVPASSEVLQLLKDPGQNAVVNLLGVPLEQRPAFFAGLLVDLLEMRSRTGRPHWIVLDEAHHILPRQHLPGTLTLPQHLNNVVFITVLPEEVLPDALSLADMIFTVGEAPERTIAAFAEGVGDPVPPVRHRHLDKGEAVAWRRGGPVRRFNVAPTRFEHRRHRRKYAEGDLGPDFSFYFRGRERKLNLRAQNLIVFSQLAEGLDDDTWTYHLRRHDYSAWFRDVIKDPALADEAAAIESRRSLSAADSRARVREAIDTRYTLPAENPP